MTPDLEEYTVAPVVDRRTKAGKAEWAEFQADAEARGLLVVTADQMTRAQAMRDAVIAQPFARALLADGDPEVTMLWERDGVSCKARADWVCGGHQVIVDLKTAADASEQGFRRAVGQWRYHMQAAHYIDAARATGLGERTFVFIVVESEPPHGVALYQLGERELHAGGVRIRRAMDAYRECVDTGSWPGYPTEISPIELAPWAL
ncbi:exonuclease VIII [Marichromatium purpuratum 984]|uniref:Exonuclease VIII n=1 Tax=Marichromatium purpuratum 984 TaxID=765910 RepID=W0E2G2_MARPU|nr:exonuclease VIII [Marichromatium purpuratum 984]